MSTNPAGRIVCVVLLSDCDGVLPGPVADLVEKRLRVSLDEQVHVLRPAASNADGYDEIIRFVTRRRATRIVIAGCRRRTASAVGAAISSATSVATANIRFARVPAFPQTSAEESLAANETAVARATKQIQREVRAARLIHDIQTVELDLDPRVVVLGDGECAGRAADEVSRLGLQSIALSGSDLVTTKGYAGSFEVLVSNGTAEPTAYRCGAVIDTRDAVPETLVDSELARWAPAGTNRVIRLESLESAARALPRIPGQRSAAIVLDIATDESSEGTAQACGTALALQQGGAFQVHILCRHVRVASPEISDLYDRAREAGVVFQRYEGRPAFKWLEAERAVDVQAFDTVLGTSLSLRCDLVAFSRHGLADREPDYYVNNLHFSPSLSTVPGYFLAGAANGEHYGPAAGAHAVTAAMEAQKMLSSGMLRVDLSNAAVDEEKCAICLTCIRTCPHQAMRVDAEKNIARNVPEACRRCGICVGVCPARAISMPGFSEDVVFALLD